VEDAVLQRASTDDLDFQPSRREALSLLGAATGSVVAAR
jgi:hypothetical protein